MYMYTIVYNCIQLYTCTQLIYIFYAGNVKHMGIQLGQDAAISSASLTNFSRRDSAEMEAVDGAVDWIIPLGG